MINRSKKEPLYRQLKELMKKNIKEGLYPVKSQIPTEKELMKEYSLGRETVRKAITELVEERYLYKKRGIGTFVYSKQPSRNFEPLVSLTYSMVVRGIEPSNIILENKDVVPEEDVKKLLKIKKNVKCRYVKRIRCMDKMPMAIEHSWFSNYDKFKQVEVNPIGSISHYLIRELNLEISRVEQVTTFRTPKLDERTHLNLDEDINVLVMDRWIYVKGYEEPIYFARFIIPENACENPY